MLTGKRVVAAYEVIGGGLAVVLLAFTSTTLSASDHGVATRTEVPIGNLPVLLFAALSGYAGVRLWQDRGGFVPSILVQGVQLLQIATATFRLYIACPLGFYLWVPRDAGGEIGWADLSFDLEAGLKYALGSADNDQAGWIRFNLFAAGLLVYLLALHLDRYLPPDPMESTTEPRE